MKELVVTTGEVQIHSNLGEIKKEVLEIAKKYDVEVTVENIKEARALGTELNKMKSAIKDVVKNELALLTEPINAFKAEAKEVDTILEDARQKLVQGVKVFDDARRLEHKQKLEDFFTFRLKEEELGAIVNTGVAHLVTLTGLTTSGELNKKSKDDVEAVVSKIKTDKLEADLTKAKKEKEDEARIAKEVELRLEKERETERLRLKKEHEDELEEAKKVTKYKEPEAPVATEEPSLFTPPAPAPTEAPTKAKSVYHITYVIEVKATPNASPEMLLERVKPILLKDGIDPISANCVEYKG